MNVSKPRLKRMAIHYMNRMIGEDPLPEQRLFAQVINLAIREIGDRYKDSTFYFHSATFDSHCEIL